MYLTAICITLGPPLLDTMVPNRASLIEVMGLPSRRLSVTLKASTRSSICCVMPIRNWRDTA